MSKLRNLINAADELLDQQPIDSEALRQSHRQLSVARNNVSWPSSPDEIKDWQRDCVEADEIMVLIEIVLAGKGIDVNRPQESTPVDDDGKDADDADVLLVRLVEARERKAEAEADIRMLLAYGREISKPRPYRLADLARAAGLSMSGVRIAYDHSDICLAREITLEA